MDVVRKNLNFSRPPGAGSGGAAGGDILGSIMMGMQNNMQKKDWAENFVEVLLPLSLQF